MGKQQSKEENHNVGEVDESNGFHVLELHAPTTFFGGTFAIVAIIVAFAIYHYCCAPGSTRYKSIHHPPSSLQPSAPVERPVPKIIVVRENRRPIHRRYDEEDRFEEVLDEVELIV